MAQLSPRIDAELRVIISPIADEQIIDLDGSSVGGDVLETVGDVLKSALAYEASATIGWSERDYVLSWKYDWSIIIDDVVRLCDLLTSTKDGSCTIHWPSSGFPISWAMEWSGGVAAVDVTVRPEPGSANFEPGSYRFEVEGLLRAFEPILRQARDVVDRVSPDPHSVNGYRDLIRVHASIPSTQKS